MKMRVFLATCALATLCACTSASPGANVAPDEQHRRIVSLIPSLTEDLFAIGAGSQVVGVSMYTDFPLEAKKLPIVASFNAVDAERIVKLHPDLIVGISSQASILHAVRKIDIPTVTFSDDSFDDIFKILQGLGVMTGRIDAAQRVTEELRRRTAALRASVKMPHKPRCLVVLGVGPIFTVGDRSFIASLITLAGGTNAVHLREAYAQYSPEAIVASDPDVIITDPLGGLMSVLDRPPWKGLRAVRARHVYIEPQYFTVPGPRYNDSLAWLIDKFKQVDGGNR